MSAVSYAMTLFTKPQASSMSSTEALPTETSGYRSRLSASSPQMLFPFRFQVPSRSEK